MNNHLGVSLVLPVHNGMPYLPETMKSILAQTFRDFECILIDDGSTDDTPAYLDTLRDPRIKRLRLDKAGLVTALNTGIQEAQGDLIARIDGDDLAAPTRLAEQVAYLSAHDNCVLLGCDFDEMDTAGQPLSVNEYNVSSDASLRLLLHFTTPFLHPGVIFRRQAFERAGGYRKQFDVAEDYDLWTRLSQEGQVASLPQKLMKKRIHASAVSVVHRSRGMSQSAEIASKYTSSILPALPAQVGTSLYWLYNSGEAGSCSPRELSRAFCDIATHYLTNNSDDEELTRTIDYLRRSLSWRAWQKGKGSLRNPLVCKSWLSAAGVICPELYRFSNLVRRLCLPGSQRAHRGQSISVNSR